MLTGLQQLRMRSKQGLYLYDGGNVFPGRSWFVAGPINQHLHEEQTLDMANSPHDYQLIMKMLTR